MDPHVTREDVIAWEIRVDHLKKTLSLFILPPSSLVVERSGVGRRSRLSGHPPALFVSLIVPAPFPLCPSVTNHVIVSKSMMRGPWVQADINVTNHMSIPLITPHAHSGLALIG